MRDPERRQREWQVLDCGWARVRVAWAAPAGLATPVALEHLGDEGGGEASARLANGDVLTREVLSGIDAELGIAPHPAYALSPFILRRQDVAGFFEFDESERQLALSDFFRRDRGARGELQRARALAALDGLSRPIGAAAGVDKVDVPREQNDFTKFLNDRIYPTQIYGFDGLSDREKLVAIEDFHLTTAIGKSTRRYMAELKRSRRAASSPSRHSKNTKRPKGS